MAEPQTPESSGVNRTDEDLQKRSGGEWARKYPPLITILVALILAIAVLPSALNLPQTNPTQTLEYAPVPPEESDETPDRKSTRLNSSHLVISYAVFCLKKKKKTD